MTVVRVMGIIGISLLLTASVVWGQQYNLTTQPDEPTRWAEPADFDGTLPFCRGFYTSTRFELNGDGWWTDYPFADQHFLRRLGELTSIETHLDSQRRPVALVLDLASPLLFKCPILFMTDVGTLTFREEEVRNLRTYFEKGGFLWVDDFWGSEAWNQWEYEIRRVLPSSIYPMIDIGPDHAIMHTLFTVKAIPQIPNVGLWGAEDTSERGADSAVVGFRGIMDERGRLMVVATHNTDIADTWEEEGSIGAFNTYADWIVQGYAIGINIWLYALTH